MDNTYEELIARLSTATPVEVDTEIARIQEKVGREESRIHYAGQRLEHEQEQQSRYQKGQLRDGWDGWASYQREIDKLQAEIDERRATVETLREQRSPLDAEYSRRSWQRWYGIEKGHIHPVANCSTFFKFLQTRYQGSYYSPTAVFFLPALSGRLIDDVIGEYGTDVCSICCAEAPVSGTSKSQKEKEERKAARDAERAAKQAKMVTVPGIGHKGRSVVYKTRRAADLALSQACGVNEVGEFQANDTARAIAQVLAERDGVSVDDILAPVQVKVVARELRELRQGLDHSRFIAVGDPDLYSADHRRAAADHVTYAEARIEVLKNLQTALKAA